VYDTVYSGHGVLQCEASTLYYPEVPLAVAVIVQDSCSSTRCKALCRASSLLGTFVANVELSEDRSLRFEKSSEEVAGWLARILSLITPDANGDNQNEDA